VANKEVYNVVRNCLVRACGLDAEEIEPDKTLFHDLDIDSIDMLEIIFAIEREFTISIKFGEFENRAIEITPGPFEEKSIVTEAGIETLKQLMPEIPPANFNSGMSVQDIPMLMTVESLCRIVDHKLAEKRDQAG